MPLLAHDYPALTPALWNACYERFGLGVRNVAMVCAAADLGEVLGADGGAGLASGDPLLVEVWRKELLRRRDISTRATGRQRGAARQGLSQAKRILAVLSGYTGDGISLV